jgi:protein ImuA
MFQTLSPSMTGSASASPRARRAGATLAEIFPDPGAEAAAVGFVLAQIGRRSGPVLWIQDRLTRCETGRPYLPGLGIGGPLLLMQLSRPADVMAAAEEGLRCRTLAAVVAEIRGAALAAGYTAMKRLALRAEAAGVPCWLIRQGASPDLSAARNRWRIATLPSAANPDDGLAPGDPRWRIELFRARDERPGVWVARHEHREDRATDGPADRLDLVAAVPDGTLAEDAGTGGQRAAR